MTGERRPYRRVPEVPRKAGDAAREVDRELEFHLEMRTRELEERGLSREAARAEARRRFGDVEAARRRLRSDATRAIRRAGARQGLAEVVRDITYAARGLRANPGYAAIAIGTLALGIGATTAIFSVVNAVLLRPLPYAEPDRLVSVWEVTPEGEDHNVVSPGNYFDWREGARSFGALGAYSYAFTAGVSGGDRPAQVRVAQATPSLLSVLGVGAAVGRVFVEDDAIAGTELVGLLSHGFWQRRFGGDSAAVGQVLTISEQPVRIAGVLPADFRFYEPGIDVMLPLRFDAEARQERRSHRLLVLGRLAAYTDIERAQAELSSVAAGIAERHPEYMEGWDVHVVGYRADLVRGVRASVLVLMSAVALVLLIACANVANLLLARAVSRRREMAVRAALGAGRARLLRQVLTESALLAAIGGVMAVLAVVATLRLLVGFGPPDVPLLENTRVDGGVLLFAGGASLLCTLLFGVLPAAQTAAADLLRPLRDGQGAGGRNPLRTRSVLLVLEVAFSVMLMVGSGLLIRSLVRLHDEDVGFNADLLIAVSLDLPYSRYPARAQQREFYGTLLARVEAIPGVLALAGTTEPPVVGFNNTFSFEIEGRPRPGPNPRQEPASLRPVTSDYFRRVGIPLVAGRAFTARDRADAPPVALINRTMADRLWPRGDAVGSRIRRGEDQPWIEVVGIVGDTRHFGLERPVEPAWYIPYDQAPWDWMSWMTLLVRSDRAEPLALAGAIEQAVWAVDPELPIGRIGLVDEYYAEALARRRFVTFLLGGFAALALLLGGVGLYGVLSYSVARRTREFGVRIALGASPVSVAAGVVREGLVLTSMGLLVGSAAALALSRFLRHLLWGVSPADPVTIASVAVVLLGAAAAACWVPARRATRANPIIALRAG